MENKPVQSLSLERALKVLRRRAWVIMTCFVVGTVAAFGFSKAQTKEYVATAALLFKSPAGAQQAAGIPVVSQNDPQGQRDTNLRLVKLGDAAQRTAIALHSGLTAGQVRSAVSVSIQGQSDIVSLSATATKPVLAAQIANTFTRRFIRQQRATDQGTVQDAIVLVEQQLAQLTPAQQRTTQGQALRDRIESLKIFKATQNNTQMVQVASVPTSPSSPKVRRNTMLGGVLGLVLGLGLAFLFDRFDRRLREPGDVEDAFGMPLLGLIPHGEPPQAADSAGRRTATIDLEPFRMLHAHLRYFNVDRQLQTMLVTSVAPSEGKTTIARNLATAAASMGTPTLLIEADLRRPMLASDLGLSHGPGLADALVKHGSEIASAVQHVDVEGRTNGSSPGRQLDVLVAGATPPNPAELLESQAMQSVLDWTKETYELVIIDAPPLSVVSDAISLIKRVDGVIVVSRIGQSTRDGSERLRDRLENLGAPTLGVVANDIRARAGSYGYYGYGYPTAATAAEE